MPNLDPNYKVARVCDRDNKVIGYAVVPTELCDSVEILNEAAPRHNNRAIYHNHKVNKSWVYYRSVGPQPTEAAAVQKFLKQKQNVRTLNYKNFRVRWYV